MERYLVSIVIPVYNVENYLSQCIESVINQTYTNIEIILINDGSNDRSGVICQDFALKDSRIFYIHQINKGLSAARNAGLAKATGSYITFIDSDDFISHHFIEKMVDLIEFYQSDIAICNHIKFLNPVADIPPHSNQIDFFNSLAAIRQLEGKNKIQFTVAWGKLYKRELFKDIDFPVNKIHEDEFIVHHLFYRSERIVYTQDIHYFYRHNINGLMSKSKTLDSRLTSIEAYLDRLKLLSKLYDSNDYQKLNRKIILKMLRILDQLSLDFNISVKHRFINLLNEYRSINKGKRYPLRDRMIVILMIKCPKFINSIYYVKKYFDNKGLPNILNIRKSLNCSFFKIKFYYYKIINRISTSIFLIDVPHSKNIGDSLITIATKQLVRDTFDNKAKILEINAQDFYANQPFITKNLPLKSLILLQGGGNLGNLYQEREQVRNDVLRIFSKSNIIVMPQSIACKTDHDMHNWLDHNSLLNAQERNIKLFIRNKNNLEMINKSANKQHAIYSLDIALYLVGHKKWQFNRDLDKQNGVLLMLRDDLESNINQETRHKIINVLNKLNLKVNTRDNTTSRKINYFHRSKIVKRQLSYIASHKLIITDRYHGLIEAAITGTPCLAIDNYNSKLASFFDASKEFHRIKMVKNLNEFENDIISMLTIEETQDAETNPFDHFNELTSSIKAFSS